MGRLISILHGDCLEVMAGMDPGSVDAVVCDPPYGLEFMGKEWDRLGDVRQVGDATFHASEADTPFGKVRHGGTPAYASDGASAGQVMQAWHERWAREALRVLKPGGHLLDGAGEAVIGARPAERELRDSIMWLYGSGFPKSLDVSKAIDKAAGAERTVTGRRSDGRYAHGFSEDAKKALGGVVASESATGFSGEMGLITEPATPEAEQWDGWGTALKPAHEPIIVARKPLAGTVARNVLEHGTGALNVDACRIGYEQGGSLASNPSLRDSINGGNGGHIFPAEDERRVITPDAGGRWPANVVLSHAEGCVRVGARRVKAITGTASGRMGADYSSGVYGGYSGDDARFGEATGYADADGMETVQAWECVDGCPVRELDEQTGVLHSGEGNVRRASGADRDGNTGAVFGAESRPAGTPMVSYGDAGGASRFFATFNGRDGEPSAERVYDGIGGDQKFTLKPGRRREAADSAAEFFYTSKASRAERNAGLDGFEAKPILWSSGEQNPGSFQAAGTDRSARNPHPTVKPIDLMRWLVRLVTPPGGTVLDPFAGSGTTGCACALEDFAFVGIERDELYVSIARARIAFWVEHPTHLPIDRALAAASARSAVRDSGQMGLL